MSRHAVEISSDRLLADANRVRREDLRYVGMNTYGNRLDRVWLCYSEASELTLGFVGCADDRVLIPQVVDRKSAAIYAVIYRSLFRPRIVRAR